MTTDNRTNEPRIDDDGQHIYWLDPVEGCWVAFKRTDYVGEEELPDGRLAKPSISQDNEGESGVGLHFSDEQFDGLLTQVESARFLAGLMRAWDVSPEQLATLRSTLESVERCAALVAAANTAPKAPCSDPVMTAPQAESDIEIHEQARRVIEAAMREAWSDADEYEHLSEIAATRVVERFNLAVPVLPSSTVDEEGALEERVVDALVMIACTACAVAE